VLGKTESVQRWHIIDYGRGRHTLKRKRGEAWVHDYHSYCGLIIREDSLVSGTMIEGVCKNCKRGIKASDAR